MVAIWQSDVVQALVITPEEAKIQGERRSGRALGSGFPLRSGPNW
jgi:hypothetical protein